MIKIDPYDPRIGWFAAGMMLAVLLRKLKARQAA
jgi:hypothetical protein